MPRPRRRRQRTFAFAYERRPQWEARRSRAGRKPKGTRAGVWHVARPTHSKRHPVHVVWRAAADAPNLRGLRAMAAIEQAFRAGRERGGFRLCHYAVLGNHAHLICEATDRRALSRGLQGLAIRVARGVNRALGRRGKLFGDRYFARPLATPLEVHRALCYVLLNHRKHEAEQGRTPARGELDACSSAVWFDGWRDLPRPTARSPASPPPVVAPATWLLSRGWRRHGLLSLRAARPTATTTPATSSSSTSSSRRTR